MFQNPLDVASGFLDNNVCVYHLSQDRYGNLLLRGTLPNLYDYDYNPGFLQRAGTRDIPILWPAYSKVTFVHLPQDDTTILELSTIGGNTSHPYLPDLTNWLSGIIGRDPSLRFFDPLNYGINPERYVGIQLIDVMWCTPDIVQWIRKQKKNALLF